MKISNVLDRMPMLGLAVALALPTLATAATTTNHKFDRKVAMACARANNIKLATAAQMSANDLNTIHACVKGFRTALHSCAQQNGITPGSVTSAQVPAYRECEKQAFEQIK